MPDIIDLRDLKGKERHLWKQAIEDQTGYKFKDLLENEPTMINDLYFVEYAEALAEDVGAINKYNSWPSYCVDWERAAWELKMDYASVEVGGETYWFRAY